MSLAFNGPHFTPDSILLCMRWYCRYALSYRDLEEMMAEGGQAPSRDERAARGGLTNPTSASRVWGGAGQGRPAKASSPMSLSRTSQAVISERRRSRAAGAGKRRAAAVATGRSIIGAGRSARRARVGGREQMQGLAERIVLMDGWRRALLALFAGAVAALGLAPVNLFAAGFVSFPILVLLIDGAAGTPGRGFVGRLGPAFRIGCLFGFGYFVAGLWWLGAAMLNDGDAFLWAIPLAVLVLPAILAFFFGAAVALAKAFWSDGVGRILALAGSVAGFEVLRGTLFTGFSWNEIGVLAAPVPMMMQSLSVVGLHGLTLGAVYVFAAPALLADARPRRLALAAAVLLAVAHVGYGAYRLGTAEKIIGRAGAPDDATAAAPTGIRIVQPNILQSQKWDAAEADRIFNRLVTLTETRPSDEPAAAGAAVVAIPDAPQTLVIWPESAFPFLLTDRPDAIARLAGALVPGETLIAGAARAERIEGAPTRYYNSIYVIDDAGEIVDARDKVHLVPFGEFLPFQETLEDLGFAQLAGNLPGGFSSGAERRNVPLDRTPSFLPLICYEIIFQDEINVGVGKERPGFIVNVTNDAWYGDTPGPYQHLRHAQITAVTFGLPLVRAANTGVSVVTDAFGRVSEGLSLGSAGTVETKLPQALSETLFSRFRNTAFWCAFAMVWAMVCVLVVRGKSLD